MADDNAVNPETELARTDEYQMRMGLLERALATLNERISLPRRHNNPPQGFNEIKYILDRMLHMKQAVAV